MPQRVGSVGVGAFFRLATNPALALSRKLGHGFVVWASAQASTQASAQAPAPAQASTQSELHFAAPSAPAGCRPTSLDCRQHFNPLSVEPNSPIPTPLRVVAVLFVLSGTWSVVGVISSLAHDGPFLDFCVFNCSWGSGCFA